MRRVVLSGHAENQIAERQLDREQVIDAVLDPDEVIPSGERFIAHKNVESADGKIRLLRVVYEDHDDFWEIVTVYRTSKIAKYRSAQ